VEHTFPEKDCWGEGKRIALVNGRRRGLIDHFVQLSRHVRKQCADEASRGEKKRPRCAEPG